MAWIESHQSLGSHPKLFAFADTLGIHPAQAIGHLHYLWWWAIEYAPDGNVTRYVTVTDCYYTSPILLRATQYPGKEEDILTALLDCGWIDRVKDDQFVIHDWDNYSNRLISIRQANAERQRRFREKQNVTVTPRNALHNATVTLHNGTTRHNTTQHNTTKPNQTKDITSASADTANPSEVQDSAEGSKRKTGYHKDARAVLHVLNEASGMHYREVDTNLGIITQRLNEPEVTFEGVKAMILRQALKWPAGDKMREYLRPATLFCKSKFDGYYAAKDVPVVSESTAKPAHQAEANLAQDTGLTFLNIKTY